MTERKHAPITGVTLLRRAVADDTGMPEWKCLHQLACLYIFDHPDKFHADVITIAKGVSDVLGLTLDWNKAGTSVETMQRYWRDIDSVVERRLKKLRAGEVRTFNEDTNEGASDE